MSDPLKHFVKEHREDFDGEEPSPALWKNIDAKLNTPVKVGVTRSWGYIGLSAITIALLTFWYLNSKTTKETSAAKEIDLSSSSEKVQTIPGQTEKADNTQQAPSETKKEISIQEYAPAAKTPDHRNITADPDNQDSVHNVTKSETEIKEGLQPESHAEETAETEHHLANTKKENRPTGRRKKTALYIPAEPSEINTYNATLYDGPDFCSLMRIYKFPGKVKIDVGRNGQDERIIVRTISCGNLENMADMKAIWIKGRTKQKLSLNIKKKFKNIVLIKKDDSVSHPVAISHYYPGLGSISGHKGRYFNLSFTDKVELILFFKNMEEGDKVIVDGILEVVVSAQNR